MSVPVHNYWNRATQSPKNKGPIRPTQPFVLRKSPSPLSPSACKTPVHGSPTSPLCYGKGLSTKRRNTNPAPNILSNIKRTGSLDTMAAATELYLNGQWSRGDAHQPYRLIQQQVADKFTQTDECQKRSASLGNCDNAKALRKPPIGMSYSPPETPPLCSVGGGFESLSSSTASRHTAKASVATEASSSTSDHVTQPVPIPDASNVVGSIPRHGPAVAVKLKNSVEETSQELERLNLPFGNGKCPASPLYCSVDGRRAPVDDLMKNADTQTPSSPGQPINSDSGLGTDRSHSISPVGGPPFILGSPPSFSSLSASTSHEAKAHQVTVKDCETDDSSPLSVLVDRNLSIREPPDGAEGKFEEMQIDKPCQISGVGMRRKIREMEPTVVDSKRKTIRPVAKEGVAKYQGASLLGRPRNYLVPSNFSAFSKPPKLKTIYAEQLSTASGGGGAGNAGLSVAPAMVS